LRALLDFRVSFGKFMLAIVVEAQGLMGKGQVGLVLRRFFQNWFCLLQPVVVSEKISP